MIMGKGTWEKGGRREEGGEGMETHFSKGASSLVESKETKKAEGNILVGRFGEAQTQGDSEQEAEKEKS